MSVHPTSIPDQSRQRELFNVRLAQAHTYARDHSVPFNPIKPNALVELQGNTYSVEWKLVRFDLMSPTQVWAVTIRPRSTGVAYGYGQVIRKQRRSKKTGLATVRYNSPAGNYSTEDEVQAALVALTAQRTQGQEVAA
ncbi:hypothetical protein [Deinococcus sp. QL22]|uniref:hypothetical protein n=1 Tax=Deinococcus sp. QL22 TaxID=2939437 RepID=UPI0020173DC7|nr:hypothetical protein [Deinococcus sp. QL22]UQN05503.1 hypothetical protein M1R55_11515 [Deinococcus sp. QL22]